MDHSLALTRFFVYLKAESKRAMQVPENFLEPAQD